MYFSWNLETGFDGVTTTSYSVYLKGELMGFSSFMFLVQMAIANHAFAAHHDAAQKNQQTM
jgi:hypothetical protein